VETRPRRLLSAAARFVALTARKSLRDAVGIEASALAYGTVLSLVPLLAAVLFVGEHVFAEYRAQVLAVLRAILPYTEETLLEYIRSFLTQAQALRGLGLAGFVVVALLTFAGIESTLNRIWNVPRRRPLGVRLYSFVMLLVWGPLLIGATYSGLLLLQQRPAFARLVAESRLLQALPLLATVVGLTIVYWLVPYTRVRLRSALVGGAVAALLFELLRLGIGRYLEVFPGLSLVYGSFALALLFMISIHAAWLIVLLGGEVAYTAQHFATMAREGRLLPALEGPWLALGTLALMADRLEQGEPAVSLAALADALEVPADHLRPALGPLRDAGILQDAGRQGEGYLLGQSPDRIRVAEVLALYDPRRQQLLEALPGPVAERLRLLDAALRAARGREVGDATLADLRALPPAVGSD
jgi:membrane protein